MDGSTDNASSLAPGFLVASPKLDGSPFERAVILLVHHDAQGAMGYIVNKPVEVDFGTLIASVNDSIEDAILEERFEQTVYFGGPVRMEQLWVVYESHEPDEPGEESGEEPAAGQVSGVPGAGEMPIESVNTTFGDGWVLSASGHVIEDFALRETDDFFMPVLGYAGWGARQLEGEIEEGSWLVADFDASLIHQTPPAECWDRALESLGVQPAAFLMMGKVGSA